MIQQHRDVMALVHILTHPVSLTNAASGGESDPKAIESESVMKMLNGYGCDHVQGYYLCKPKPADDVLRWLQESQWRISAVRAAS